MKQTIDPRQPYIPLRWRIAAILFASTVINYIDRQTLSLLAPYLKHDYKWTNTDYVEIVIAFRVAYCIGQSACGRFIDCVGTRRGLTITVACYSAISILTSLATSFRGFMTFRFLLGLGESANWPAATKSVAEWFPRQERALAAAFFDSGSSIGAAIAPFIVLGIYYRWGWRLAFAIPGLLGVVWLVICRRMYYRPQDHPRIRAGERRVIRDQAADAYGAKAPQLSWAAVLKIPQTWA